MSYHTEREVTLLLFDTTNGMPLANGTYVWRPDNVTSIRLSIGVQTSLITLVIVHMSVRTLRLRLGVLQLTALDSD